MVSFSEVLLSLILFTYSQHQSENIKLKNSEINNHTFQRFNIVYDCPILLYMHHKNESNRGGGWGGGGGCTTHTQFCLSHGFKMLCGLADTATLPMDMGNYFRRLHWYLQSICSEGIVMPVLLIFEKMFSQSLNSHSILYLVKDNIIIQQFTLKSNGNLLYLRNFPIAKVIY